MIKAIIYDLDDLMINSNPLHVKTWDRLLKEYGYRFSDLPQEIRSEFIGMRVTDILREVIKQLELNVDESKFYKKRMEISLEIVQKKLEPMPGVFKSIKLFKNKNYKLAIASSGPKEYIDLVFSKRRLKNTFNVIVSGDDVKAGKPNPEIYMVVCEKLGLAPDECVVLEDATVGIESAKEAGCKCVAVKNRYTPPQTLSKADICIDSLNDLSEKIIKSL